MLDDHGVSAWYARLRAHGLPPSSVTYKHRRCLSCHLPCLERISLGEGRQMYSDYPVDYDGPHRCPPETMQVQYLKNHIAHLERLLDSDPQPATSQRQEPQVQPETASSREPLRQSSPYIRREPPQLPGTPNPRWRPATSPPDDDDRIIGVNLDPE
jgi:hypothetical protein